MTVSELRITYPLLTDSRFEEQMQREQDCHFVMFNQLSYLRHFKDKHAIREKSILFVNWHKPSLMLFTLQRPLFPFALRL